ncbi:CHAP domain-containing protein [Flavobacterium sp. MK4S-17]|uniref:CHAP domain-containing protein n=1 Tax=Flavobacterium sp. MK4S-17 TaxID=2543737 RepID=UPI00135C6139|nr:CHAP domain-containing protein [Flavobacterium sp. MK4S-17]
MKCLKVIQIALAEVGTTEVPKNSNKTKYGKWFGLNGVAWCGIFCSWVYAKAGVPLGNIGFTKGFAGCQTAVAHFKKTGEITTTPQVGDLVFFDWNKDKRHDHVGIFNGWKDKGKGEFYTVEGNTAIGNDSNGGQVMSRTRNTSVALFVHPKVLDQ